MSSVCSGHVALHEQRAPLGVEPGGEQEHHGAARPFGELWGVVRLRERVEVDDAVQRLLGRGGFVLCRDPVADRAEIVPEMLLTGRLDSGKDARHGA